MSAILRAIKAAYNFLTGDAILLTAVIIAFGLDGLLAHVTHTNSALMIVVFLVIVVGGLVTTLGRELVGRR